MCENILGYAYASRNGRNFLIIHIDYNMYINYCKKQSNENDCFGILANQILENLNLKEDYSIIFTPCDSMHPLEYRGDENFIKHLKYNKFTYDKFKWQGNI